ncbi:hypothetical protein RUM44_005638 [Polyplax serrata]|uniref:Uncharacterized protein n=1 Tax=Polyplax serrata TaxID=468196 RepID=A0ABR1ADX8_POLSC
MLLPRRPKRLNSAKAYFQHHWRLHFQTQSRQQTLKGSPNDARRECGSINFLTIAPALPLVGDIRKQPPRFGQRSSSSASFRTGTKCKRVPSESSDLDVPPHDVCLQATSDGKVQVTRSQRDREKSPDRICFDR